MLAAKYAQLTTRPAGQLTTGQAHVACAAAVLHWIYALTVQHTVWDPRIAAGVIPHDQAAAATATPMADLALAGIARPRTALSDLREHVQTACHGWSKPAWP